MTTTTTGQCTTKRCTDEATTRLVLTDHQQPDPQSHARDYCRPHAEGERAIATAPGRGVTVEPIPPRSDRPSLCPVGVALVHQEAATRDVERVAAKRARQSRRSYRSGRHRPDVMLLTAAAWVYAARVHQSVVSALGYHPDCCAECAEIADAVEVEVRPSELVRSSELATTGGTR